MTEESDSLWQRFTIDDIAKSVAEWIDGTYDDGLEVFWTARPLNERIVVTVTDANTRESRGFSLDVAMRTIH